MFCFPIMCTIQVILFKKNHNISIPCMCKHIFISLFSWGFVRERERPGDPSGVWRPEPDPPRDQTAAPAARHDPGRAAAIRLRRHRPDRQEGHAGRVGTGEVATRGCVRIQSGSSVSHVSSRSSSRWMRPVSSSWAWCWPPSRKYSKIWTSWGEEQRPCCCCFGGFLKTCFCVFAAKIKMDFLRKTSEIPAVKTPQIIFNLRQSGCRYPSAR